MQLHQDNIKIHANTCNYMQIHALFFIALCEKICWECPTSKFMYLHVFACNYTLRGDNYMQIGVNMKYNISKYMQLYKYI